MLNQLIESKNNQSGSKIRRSLMMTTFILVFSLCLSAVTFSLFAKELGTGIGEFEMSTLVAPIVENAPPAPVKKEETPQPANQTKSVLPTRRENILRIDENPIAPKEISTAPNTQKARPIGKFIISGSLETEGARGNILGRNGSENGSGLAVGDGTEPSELIVEKVKTPPPPPSIKKPVEDTVKKPRTLPTTSGGVVNGKAKFLPKPIYTAAAKAVKATGDVNVQVMIDETGNVVSAKAVNGHPLLRVEAEKAARSAKFNPTLLTNQPVKVSGIIVYKFSM